MRSTLPFVTSFVTLALLHACGGSKAPVEDVVSPVPEPPPGSLDAEVLAVMDRAVDPCVDFYAYACGGWLAKTELPADKPIMVRSFSSIGDRNQEVLRGMLDGYAAAPPAGDAEAAKLGAFYASCLDQAAIDGRGLEPMADVLGKIDALKSTAQVMGLAGALAAEGVPTLLEVWADADAKDPTTAITQLGQGGTGLPEKGYYFDERHAEVRAAYQAHVAELLTLSGTPADRAATDAAAVLALETALAEHQYGPEEMRDSDKTYNKRDRAGLKAGSKLDWDAYFAALGRPELAQFNVTAPPFFEHAPAVLAKAELSAVKAWLRFHTVSAMADDLPTPIAEASFRFYGQTLEGQREQRPRWKRCVEKTDQALGDLLAKAYVAKEFPGDSKQIALEMIGDIEAAFEQGLPDLVWMDDETRARAVDKARQVTNKIGYPDVWREYPFEVTAGDFLGNRRRAGRADVAWWMAKAEKPVDPNTWFMTAPTVNAYYNPTQNEIAFPAGIMQPPFFSAKYPRAMNYGAMGMVMGHELTHGFDDDGRKYDGDGRLTEWWAPPVVEKFEQAAACVETQYDGYEVQPGLHLSGQLTLGENIADLGGLRLAYRAYRGWVAEHGEEPPVAGLTGDQLLFVSHAQAWCSVASPEVVRVRAASDPHAPPKFRVNGPVVNLPEFGDAFGCEVGEPMRPAEVCEVW